MTDKRKTIIALHGAGMNASVFGGIAPLLGDDHNFHAITLPGHDVGRGELLYSIQAMSDWVKERIDTSEGQVVLLGHSMGALIALQAANAPGVESIILLGASAAMPVNADLLKGAKDNPGETIRLMLKWSVYPDGTEASTVKQVLEAMMRGVNPKALSADLEACNAFADGAAIAAKLHKPALVISATHDKMARAMEGEGLSRLLPEGTYRVIAGAGHMMMVEQALETANEIRAFLQHPA